MNTVCIVGRLVRDPEVRTSANGNTIVTTSIAFNHTKEETSFFDIVAFKKTGDLISEYFTKGDQIGVTGALKQRIWESQDGQKRNKIEILVNNITFIGSKNNNNSSSKGDNYNAPNPKARNRSYEEEQSDQSFPWD